MPSDRPPRRVDRSQLPEEFTAETVRAMGFRMARFLANPRNGVLTPDEQVAFDRALREELQGSADRLGRSVRRARHGQPLDLDPDLRRSYQRTQQRLDAQAERTRRAFPQLTDEWGTGEPTTAPELPAVDGAEIDVDGGEDESIGTLAAEIEQTSDTLDILEQIASLQQQQLEHQRSQLLSETRGLFFALAVSIAVIIAGVAPLVEASAHDRRLILAWTAAVCVLGGVGYAAVRARQSKSD